jgi:hypothetical protein
MMHNLLFVSVSLLVFGLLKFIQAKRKHIKSGTILGLFLFGIMLSIPFVLIEHLAFNLKYYLVVLAFIAIELIVVTMEHKWEYLHNLIHHNIKELRLLSFFIVSIGFTYSEISFHILNNTHTIGQLLTSLPIKAVFALFIHTVLTSSAAVLTATESIVEHVCLFLLYYLRLIFISISHYLYVFFSEHDKIAVLLIPLMAYNLYLLFKHKKYLDKKGMVLAS